MYRITKFLIILVLVLRFCQCTLYRHSLIDCYVLITFHCINLMSYLCIAFLKLLLFIFYCQYHSYYIKDKFFIHFDGSLECWINKNLTVNCGSNNSLWGHEHTHSSSPTQAIFGPFQGPAQNKSPLAARCPFQSPVRRSWPITDQLILTNHRWHNNNKRRPRGPEKAVSTQVAEEVLATRYHYKNYSLYNQATKINSINCWSAV